MIPRPPVDISAAHSTGLCTAPLAAFAASGVPEIPTGSSRGRPTGLTHPYGVCLNERDSKPPPSLLNAFETYEQPSTAHAHGRERLINHSGGRQGAKRRL